MVRLLVISFSLSLTRDRMQNVVDDRSLWGIKLVELLAQDGEPCHGVFQPFCG